MKHTPGPWTVDVPPSSCLTTRFVSGPEGEHICKVGHMDWTSGSLHSDIANARLIAAAPEMAEALREVWDYLSTIADVSENSREIELGDSVRDILARLEG